MVGKREGERKSLRTTTKNLPGVVAAKRLGLSYAFGTVYMPASLHGSFLAGGGVPLTLLIPQRGGGLFPPGEHAMEEGHIAEA